MRCNRKTVCFAGTPRKKVVKSLNITDISQLRRNLKSQSGNCCIEIIKYGIIGFMVQIAVWLLRRANKFARY